MRVQRAILFIILAGCLGACASSKKAAYTPAGTWEYLVRGTPEGDDYGTFVLTVVDDVLVGEVISKNYGRAPMEGVSFGEGNVFSCNFFMADADLDMNGTFEGNSFEGTIDAGQFGVFNMTANRKAER